MKAVGVINDITVFNKYTQGRSCIITSGIGIDKLKINPGIYNPYTIQCKYMVEVFFIKGVIHKMKKKVLFVFIGILLFLIYFVYNGYIWVNTPDSKKYKVRGIDVSNHQGVIKWNDVKKQGFEFAYIKSTEGKDYKDKYFEDNWINTKAAGISRGAYHFFTFGSSGLEQAANFISTVPVEKDSLPVVIDIEFGGNSKNIPDRDKLRKELKNFIYEVESTYKNKPILYLTYDSYNKYIKGDFEEYSIWVRDIFKFPNFDNGQNWTLWQYCNRGRVKGITGFVDINVFNGSLSEFNKLKLK